MMKIIFALMVVATCVHGAAPTAVGVTVTNYQTAKVPAKMTITVTPATELVATDTITVTMDKEVFGADGAAVVESTKVASVTDDTCVATGAVSGTGKILTLTLASVTAKTCKGLAAKVMTIIVTSNLKANPAAATVVTPNIQTKKDATDKAAATYTIQALITNCDLIGAAAAKCTKCEGGYKLATDACAAKFAVSASTNCKTAKVWSTASTMDGECGVCKDGFLINADKMNCDACADKNAATCTAAKKCATSKAGFKCSADGKTSEACATNVATCSATDVCITAKAKYKCSSDKKKVALTTAAPVVTTVAPTSAPSSAAAFGSTIAVAITFVAMLN